MRPVDHECECVTARGRDTGVERNCRRCRRVVIDSDESELVPEARHERLVEPLRGIGAVVDDDHFVLEIVDVALIRTRQRVQGTSRFAPHVMEDHDDAERDRGRGRRWRDGRPRKRGIRCRDASPVPCCRTRLSCIERHPPHDGVRIDTIDGRGHTEPRTHVADRALDARIPRTGDDDGCTRREEGSDLLERRGHRRSQTFAEPHQCEALDRRVGKDLCRGSLQEAYAFVERSEPCETVADLVQVSAEAIDHGGGVARRGLCALRRGRDERVGDPDVAVTDLVRLEKRAQEHRSPAASGADLRDVARHVVGAHGEQRLLQPIELSPPHVGVREVGRGSPFVNGVPGVPQLS